MAEITGTESGATGRYIDLGSPAALGNLGSQTILAYGRPTGSGGGGFGYFYGKTPTGSINGPRFFVDHNAGSPLVTFGAHSGTAGTPTRQGAANSATYNSWGHYAVSWDGTLTATGIHLYAGVGVYLAEISYLATANGTGSVASDAANPCFLMNRYGLGREFVGDVAYIAVWDGVLSLSQLQNAQNNGPLAEPTGLVLLWVNQEDLGPNAFTPSARSTYVAGGLPPNTALGGTPELVTADGSHAHAADNLTLTTEGSTDLVVADVTHAHAADNLTLMVSGAIDLVVADVTHAHSSDNVALITIADDFERSSVNPSLSSVSGTGDAAVITLRPRVQESEVVSGQTRWLSPIAKVSGVNGTRPTFRFNRFRVDVDGGYHYGSWDAGRKPMFSYDMETWQYFDTTTINSTGNIDTGYVEFRDNTAFTSDTVYVSKGRVRTVAQTGAWIDALESAYPGLIHNAASNVSGFSSGTFTAQANELGATIQAQPFYAFKISDSTLGGQKGTIALISGVHAGEDQGNWVLESAVEFLLGSDPAAQNVRQHFDVFVYPMVNAPGRAGGGWRGSFTQGAGGIDDANRHFSDASPNLEIVTIPRAAMQTDMPGSVHVAIDFHGTLHEAFSLFVDAGNPYQPLFDAALETYMGAGAVIDEGNSHAGFVSEWFRASRFADFAFTTETGDPSTLTDAQIQSWGVAHIKAISDLFDAGDISLSVNLVVADALHAHYADGLVLALPVFDGSWPDPTVVTLGWPSADSTPLSWPAPP